VSGHAFRPVFFNETHDRATSDTTLAEHRWKTAVAGAASQLWQRQQHSAKCSGKHELLLARSDMQLPSTERDEVSTSFVHFFYQVLPAESRGSLSHVAPLGQANRGSSCTPLWAQPGQALADGSPPLFSRTQATYSSKRLGHGSSSAYPAKFASTWREGDGEQKKRQPARPTHTEKERRHARRQERQGIASEEDRASRQKKTGHRVRRRQGIASVLAQASLPLERRELPFTVLSS
jgi:hypothetical protein